METTSNDPQKSGPVVEQCLHELGALYLKWGTHLQDGATLLRDIRIAGEKLRKSLGGGTVTEFAMRQNLRLFSKGPPAAKSDEDPTGNPEE